jgi:hypothetical protein
MSLSAATDVTSEVRKHAYRGWFASIVLLQAIAVVAFAWVTPPGEAQDEPAHLWYVAWLATTGRPPSPELSAPTVGYEAYQPPLGYLPAALVGAAVDLDIPTEEDWPRNPSFSFDRPTRAFTVRSSSIQTVAWGDLLSVRLAGLGWLAITTWSGLIAVKRSFIRADLFCAFALAPQLIWMHAGVTNDSAVTAVSTVALLLLLLLFDQSVVRMPTVLAAGLVLGLAIWCKASAVFLLPIAVVAVLHWWRGGDRRASMVFSTALGAALLGLVALNLGRFGSILPEPPAASGFQPESLLALLRFWSWVPGLAASFWAKVGWLNILLPTWCYLWFAVPSGFIILGVFGRVRPRSSQWRHFAAILAVLSNFALLIVYLVTVHWQPQGRHLWPSWLGMAVLASDALNRWWPDREFLVPTLLLSSLFLALTIVSLLRVY